MLPLLFPADELDEIFVGWIGVKSNPKKLGYIDELIEAFHCFEANFEF